MSPPAWRRNLLWIDGLAGLSVGLFTLALRGWLAGLFALPLELVTFMGVMNVVYGTVGVTLASRARRRTWQVGAMAVANGVWTVVCAGILVRFGGEASGFGVAQVVAEGVFCAGLAGVEWRSRGELAGSDVDSRGPN